MWYLCLSIQSWSQRDFRLPGSFVLISSCSDCPHREGTNIEVRVEIETHPRGARQSSLSSILSSRSLSVESLGHSQSTPQDYLCASEREERREGGEGGEDGEEQEGREKPGGDAGGHEETVYPVFEIDDVWGPFGAGFVLGWRLVGFFTSRRVAGLTLKIILSKATSCFKKKKKKKKRRGPPTSCLLAPASKERRGF